MLKVSCLAQQMIAPPFFRSLALHLYYNNAPNHLSMTRKTVK